MQGLRFVATGHAVPKRVVTNEDMSHIIETSDEWIVSRTGVRERRYCTTERTSDLAFEAATIALERAGIDKNDLCACVCTSVTPDAIAPTIASYMQQRLELPGDIPCFDMNAGCSGFPYGLKVTRGLLMQDKRPYALLIGAESLSKITNFQDRSTCILFGDGAAACVLTLDDTKLFYGALGARGEETIQIGGIEGEKAVIKMDGQAVFRFAVESLSSCALRLVDEAGLTLDDIDWFIPHQANRRIFEAAAKRLGVPMERFYFNIDRFGNTSSASIPLCMDEMQERGLLKRGQKIICVGFGSGLTWGGALVEW